MHTSTFILTGTVARPTDRLGKFARSSLVFVVLIVLLAFIFISLSIGLVPEANAQTGVGLYGRAAVPYQYTQSLADPSCRQKETMVGLALVLERRCQ